jgi:hypothetical protein
MKAAKLVMAAIFFTGTVSACARHIDQGQIAKCWAAHHVYNLEGYRNADAVKDAKHALAKNDKRLLALRGVSLYVPGLDEPMSQIKSKYAVDVIDGTSDTFCDKRHEELNAIARKYATAYNQVIISRAGS